MKEKDGFISAFLVFGFVMLVVGFLAGILAISLVNLELDSGVLIMVFSVGFLVGMLAVALVLTVIRLNELRKTA